MGDSPSKPLSVELRLMYETNKERAVAPQLAIATEGSVLSTVYVLSSSHFHYRTSRLTRASVLLQRGREH